MMREATIQGIINGLEAMASRSDSVGILSTISFPTLIILGEHDPFTPEKEVDLMQSKLMNGRVVKVPKTAHLYNLENPGTYNKELKHYLYLSFGK
jgi:pimeloyl-ACP methyl ester carboxylesterase